MTHGRPFRDTLPRAPAERPPHLPLALLRRRRSAAAAALHPEALHCLRKASLQDPDFRRLAHRAFLAPGRVRELLTDSREEMNSRERMEREALVNATAAFAVREQERVVAAVRTRASLSESPTAGVIRARRGACGGASRLRDCGTSNGRARAGTSSSFSAGSAEAGGPPP